MDDSVDQVRLVLSLTLDASARMSTGASICAANAVITFSHEQDGIRCDGKISLRLTLTD